MAFVWSIPITTTLTRLFYQMHYHKRKREKLFPQSDAQIVKKRKIRIKSNINIAITPNYP